MVAKRFFNFGYMHKGNKRIPAVEEWVRNGSGDEKWVTYDCSELSAVSCFDKAVCETFQTIITVEGNEGGVGASLIIMSQEAKNFLNQFDDVEAMLLPYLDI